MIIWILMFLVIVADGWNGDKHKFNCFMLAGFAEFIVEAAIILINILN